MNTASGHSTSTPPRRLRVDFPDFVRVLAHFRPVDEDTGTRDPNEPEPLNSRMNKLRCELVGSPQVRPLDLPHQ